MVNGSSTAAYGVDAKTLLFLAFLAFLAFGSFVIFAFIGIFRFLFFAFRRFLVDFFCATTIAVACAGAVVDTIVRKGRAGSEHAGTQDCSSNNSLELHKNESKNA